MMNNNNYSNNNRNNGGNNNQQQPQQETRKKAKLYLEEPLEFVGTIDGHITTTVDLAKNINTLFNTAFGDYEGSVISQNHLGELTASLFFKDTGAGNIEPLVKTNVRGSNKSMSPAERVRNMNLRNINKTYTLSEELKEILEQFLNLSPKAKVNWDRMYSEVAERMYGGMNNIYVRVDNININKVLKVLYGSETANKERLEYNITVIKPIGMGAGGINQNHIIKVDRLNVKEIERLANKVGMMPSVGTIPMIRDM